MKRDHSEITPAWQDLACSADKKQTLIQDKKNGSIRLEISANKLRHLLNMGVLCAADFRCLDCKSKQCVWQICLADCVRLQ